MEFRDVQIKFRASWILVKASALESVLSLRPSRVFFSDSKAPSLNQVEKESWQSALLSSLDILPERFTSIAQCLLILSTL